ncbi:putative high-affinity nicotinic acid transporter [Mollisia scopiformis]|uniref:Putative high-affinity nicotinic acid transporter n=1 Tax=Mollisia scopiformis TaxID=149040 RepID=A0A194XG32_MOLSC|nr:putative high-affinity nicotinic acid transporter [Mollisia scopiformis]KUJ19133.1 putative high-affinity nicotinic acid transporter [Mollisia scopiformis]
MLDRKASGSDNSGGEEKQIGLSTSIDPATIDAPVPLEAAHAAEYVEFLQLKNKFESDPKAYKALIRRLDLRIIPMLFLYYLLNSLDKSNAGNVKIYTFLEDTHMTSHQFNLALTWYFFTYAGLEAPSNMCMRKFGPKLWLSGLVICWGAVTLGSAWVKSYGDYCAARIMLGVFEAGLFQGFYTLSCWYLSSELQTRCAYWYSATMLSGAFGGLLAYAVGPLQGHLGLKQWQYLFIIEGAITMFIGIIGLWLCVDFPETWSSRFFKADEMKFLQLRVKYANGPIAPDDTFRWSAFWEAVKDWKTYFIASLLAFGGSVPTYSVNYTLATMVKSLGYSSIKAQALTAPPYVFAFFCVILIALYSDAHRCRARSLLISYTVGTTGIVILWPCLYHPSLAGVSYFALFLVVAGYNMQAPAVGSWLGTNVRKPAKRAAAMGWQSTFGQLLGGCIGANIFVTSEAPTYNSGFITLLVLVMVGGVGATIANWYCLRASNLKKDRIPAEELEGRYTEKELSEMGEYSPYFRYIL